MQKFNGQFPFFLMIVRYKRDMCGKYLERTIAPSEILEYCSKKWFDNPAGISALDLAKHLQITNEAAMRIFESFNELEYGTLNRNVKLYSAHFDPKNVSKSMDFKEEITHIFFPSSRVLATYYEKLGLLRQNFPEYKKRLKLGAGQMHPVYFEEEVLRKYFDHPEKYEVEDSESGGLVLSRGEEIPYIWVRYSKRKLENGNIAVGAIYKDLAAMSDTDQKYWSSYEVKGAKFVEYEKDEAFQRFVKNQIYGEFADYVDPIAEVFSLLKKINEAVGVTVFRQVQNKSVIPPIENTFKSFCDSCSELDKLFANGNIDGKNLKNWMMRQKIASESDFICSDNKHPEITPRQMLKLLESKVCGTTDLLDLLKECSDYRQQVAHHMTASSEEVVSYSQKFYDLCKRICEAGETLESKIKETSGVQKNG